ncbi:hypothetical protein [Desulforamulus aeronauticus]|uniref:Uncharacterized protein n=1 Tax=Desulforamulus aeronauticus DSM 10349 TaxID=1121421 RepID=A0A1M6VBX1_9FIRM|nr:hypothetical protein [Desulforamulus aeronauticus]SHK79003.1 hypothetical protein SAMN02745123_03124 [Desulforamulus aeronauticus DSM 10349]
MDKTYIDTDESIEEYIDNYIVYVKTDENSNITAINSSAFLQDTTDWNKIDEGIGDVYHHAQGNYLEKGLFDNNGCYNYKLVDSIILERTDEEKQIEISVRPVPEPSEIELLKKRADQTEADNLTALEEIAGAYEKALLLEAENAQLKERLAAVEADNLTSLEKITETYEKSLLLEADNTQLKERLIVAEADNITALKGTALVYEKTLDLETENAQLKEKLAAAEVDTLTALEGTATVYEELLALKEQIKGGSTWQRSILNLLKRGGE